MNRSTQDHKAHIQTRGALWASIVFYVLIAFEFFYMASPFTAYLYAVYGPGRDWLQASPWTSWTIQFFLPHVVAESRSVFVEAHETIGFVLFGGGIAGFAIGVFQIYRAKLRRSDAVMGGLYRYIRHTGRFRCSDDGPAWNHPSGRPARSAKARQFRRSPAPPPVSTILHRGPR